MQELTSNAAQAVQNLAQRYGVSQDAVRTLLNAVSAGGGTMAQFSHPELGGGGQWMSGGMTMVGDMFNSGLQSTVSGLCSELASLLNSTQVFVPPPPRAGGSNFSNNWWPGDLGSPSSSGGQNGSRYAYFPQACRLAIEENGQVTLYNTLDHQIGGVQQQQGYGPGSLSFSSQFGTFTVSSLPRADQSGSTTNQPPPFVPQPVYNEPPPPPPPMANNNNNNNSSSRSANELISAIERLGQLHQQGVISNEEFSSKKAQLLALL